EFRARYWALTQLAQSMDSTARAAREFIVLNDPSDHMRQEALRQLSGNDPSSWVIIMSALGDPSDIVRGEAIHAIGRRDSAAAQPIAVDLIRHDRSFYVQGHALDVYNPALASEGTGLLVELTQHGGTLGVRLTAAGRL